MQVGDLVKNRFCGSLLVIVKKETGGYYDVYEVKTGDSWHMLKEDLEVIICK